MKHVLQQKDLFEEHTSRKDLERQKDISEVEKINMCVFNIYVN